VKTLMIPITSQIAIVILGCISHAADLRVDPILGDDANDGIAKPLKTIPKAISIASPADTIHLLPMVYRDWAPFLDRSGEPGRPITLDGHGAILDGCDVLNSMGWTEHKPGLYSHSDLMPLTDAIIDRWFFVFDGKLNRMSRCSKGPCEPLKQPEALAENEWTFVKDEERTKTARLGYIHGTFWIRLAKGVSIEEAKLEYPFRMAGVAMRGSTSHIVVRNLTSKRPYNDGFNLSDCQDIEFENIQAIDCGDDGMSAHGDCQYHVRGFRSIGNATGICDTGNSDTVYDDIFIDRCIGFDLYFLDSGRYQISDAIVRSESTRPLYLLGRDAPAIPCRLELNRVHIERKGSGGEVRVSPNCQLNATDCTFLNLDWHVAGGTATLENCTIGGMVHDEQPRKPRLIMGKDAAWLGNGNRFDFE
jgi:hypothetical protein